MRYDKRSLQRALQKPDKPGDAARRVREREAGQQAHREALERFGAVTASNFAEFAEWQEMRMRELYLEQGEHRW